MPAKKKPYPPEGESDVPTSEEAEVAAAETPPDEEAAPEKESESPYPDDPFGGGSNYFSKG